MRQTPNTRAAGTRSTTAHGFTRRSDKAIQTPNSDTPYSAVGADLRRAIGAASLLMESNWLPAPKGPFMLVPRLYWPKPDALNGVWNFAQPGEDLTPCRRPRLPSPKPSHQMMTAAKRVRFGARARGQPRKPGPLRGR